MVYSQGHGLSLQLLVLLEIYILHFVNLVKCHPIKKKTSINENQTTKKTILVQSKTEPVVQTTTSFDVKPTKQYPVLDEIQNIISNLSKLETNNKNHKAVFIKYNVIKRQFYVDYQKTIDMLAKLNKTKQTEEKYWESFRRYLDLFKEQKDIIYKQLT